MNGESANKFISALVKSLQTLCHGYVDFNDGIEIIGHLYLNIDSGSSFDYIVKEKVCKSADNGTIFVSKSFQAHSPPGEVISRKDKDDTVFDDTSMSPTSGTHRIQSAITNISNVLSGQPGAKSHPAHHHAATTGKRKRDHGGPYNIQPGYKYTTLQSSSSSGYFNSASKQGGRTHPEHFNNSSHAEFFGGDSNQGSGMGADDEDDLDLDVTFVKDEYQRNSGQRVASRLSQDQGSSHSNVLHDGQLNYPPNHSQAPQQFASGTAGDLSNIDQNFQDPSQLELGQQSAQGPPNPRTSVALLSSGQANRITSSSSSVASTFDLPLSHRQSSHMYSKVKGVELLHTVRQTRWAVTKAREWLSLHGMNVNFEDFADEQLDQMFLGFYTSGLKKDGSSFSATALLAFRTAINRYLLKRGRSANIATSHKFKQSNAVLSRLMSTSVKMNKTISTSDIQLMYTSGTLSNSTPESLLYKVWFELQMNFGRKLDWSQVLAEHFFFSHNSVGKLVVTWNTRGMGNCDQLTIIEADDGRYCPVRSLHLYMKHRNQAGKAMLQVPASSDLQSKGVWYLSEDIRDYKEKNFMKKISALAKLSRVYTNACALNCSEEYYHAMLSLNSVDSEPS